MKVSNGPWSLWFLYRRILLHLFQLLVALGSPGLRQHNSNYCPCLTLTIFSVFLYVFSPLLRRPPIIGLGLTLNLGWSHFKIITLITSTKTLFSKKTTFWCFEWTWTLGNKILPFVARFNPLQVGLLRNKSVEQLKLLFQIQKFYFFSFQLYWGICNIQKLYTCKVDILMSLGICIQWRCSKIINIPIISKIFFVSYVYAMMRSTLFTNF